LSSSQTIKQEVVEEGSHCQANPVAQGLQNRWHRFWAVWLFRCEGASPEILEIFAEIPDFPETPENPGFTDKFVLSGDFSGLAYSPPLGDIKILSIGIRAWCSDASLTAWSLKMSTSCEVSFEPLRFDGSNYDSWSAHVLHVLHTWGSPFEQVVEASILPEDFDSEDTSNLSKEEKENVLHNYSITNLM
jgi:hypothetical protein